MQARTCHSSQVLKEQQHKRQWESSQLSSARSVCKHHSHLNSCSSLSPYGIYSIIVLIVLLARQPQQIQCGIVYLDTASTTGIQRMNYYSSKPTTAELDPTTTCQHGVVNRTPCYRMLSHSGSLPLYCNVSDAHALGKPRSSSTYNPSFAIRFCNSTSALRPGAPCVCFIFSI